MDKDRVFAFDYENYEDFVGTRVRESERLENALRRFKKDCERNGIMSEMKKRQYYEKPSVIRKRKIDAVERKRKKKLRKLQRYLNRK